MDIQSIKLRFGIIGNSPMLDRAIDIASQVAPTDISVLITGESGVGKENFPKIIHQLSARKHGPYIAVNCGAIPEGTIDSELFGHEKGSFTGANDARKGYFEVVNGGTIFLDEVAELPLLTQVRLLRVLETGEFIKVGSSNVQKTNVRVVAATNVNLQEAIRQGKFREDLFYRLNTVPIFVPALRERKDDIILLFKKFANDFAEKYRMPPLQLDESAQKLMLNYRWSGNIRQLKNLTEQISVIEKSRIINGDILLKYLPHETNTEFPILVKSDFKQSDISEREILYKVLWDMKKDVTDLKKLVIGLLQDKKETKEVNHEDAKIIKKFYNDVEIIERNDIGNIQIHQGITNNDIDEPFDESEEIEEETLSIEKKEIDLIKKALEKHKGNRKNASEELEISERTLYRKIKEYGL